MDLEPGEVGAIAEAEANGRVLTRRTDGDAFWTNRTQEDAPRYATACAAWLAAALEDDLVGTKAARFATALMRRAFPDGPSAIERRGRDEGRVDPQTDDDLAAVAEARAVGYMPVTDRGNVQGYAFGRTLEGLEDIGRHPRQCAAWLATVARAEIAHEAPYARRLALLALDADDTALTREARDPVGDALRVAVRAAGVARGEVDGVVADLRGAIARKVRRVA